jgi:putative Mg2+ transporter-C (MgtC) family protein
MNIIAQLSLLGIIIIAGALGGLVGLEREFSSKSAGLRTHMFVAMATAGLILLGEVLINYYAFNNPFLNFRSDPLRILQAVIVGISFIGGGIIFKDMSHHVIRNLTTATSILVTAIIGICVALQLYFVAVGLTIIVVGANQLFVRLEKKIHPKEYDTNNKDS